MNISKSTTIYRDTGSVIRLAGSLGLLVAGAMTSSVLAAAESHSVIEEVIVTAQRRPERLQDVPVAVAAVTSEQLVSQGISNTLDLGRSVPSLTMTNFGGYALPRIRGIGNNVIGAGYEGGVATYVDGVYIAAAPASLFSFNNIERIEVLRGPQGTLFGRNATGGLIQVITREPSSTLGGSIELGLDNYRTTTADVYVTGGLASSLAADFAGHVSSQDEGYGVNRFNGEDVYKMKEDIALRSSLLFTSPGGNTGVRVTGDYEKNEGSMYAPVKLAPGTSTVFPQGYLNSEWDINSDLQPYSRFEGAGASVSIDQKLGFAQLTSITAYRQSTNLIIEDIDATPTPGVNLLVRQPDNQLSQELQLGANPSSSIKWVAGAYYSQSASKFDPSGVSFSGIFQAPTPFGPLAAANTHGRQRVDALAGYAQATAPIADQTNLTLGIRYSTERHRLDATQSVDIAGGPANVPLPPIPDQSQRFSRPTWRVSLDHRFSPEFMAYASYNRGFKSGGFNVAAPTDPAYKPEKLDAYEIGLKSDLFDGRLRLNSSAFYYDYTNLQVIKYTGTVTTIYNGASARVYGLDADFEARLNSNFSLSGGFTLLHDRFTDFPAAVIATQVPGGVITTVGSAKDNRLPQTPDIAANVSADYHHPVAFGEIGLNVSYSYNDGYFTQPDNILAQPSYDTLAATLRMEFPHGIGLRLWGRNLTNSLIAQNLSAGQFNSVVTYGAPRTFGVTVTANF